MRRDQLEHAVRTACQIIERREVIVVALGAEETERLADLIEGVAGEFSPFEKLHGFSIDGVDLNTAVLPLGWRDRLVKIQNANTAGPSGDLQFHWMVSRQGGPLRRQALCPPGEGPKPRRGTP